MSSSQRSQKHGLSLAFKRQCKDAVYSLMSSWIGCKKSRQGESAAMEGAAGDWAIRAAYSESLGTSILVIGPLLVVWNNEIPLNMLLNSNVFVVL